MLDGALLDVRLAGGDSYVIAETLRGRNIPFAFTTGHDPKSIDQRFKDAMVLQKPFAFESMTDLVRKLLLGR